LPFDTVDEYGLGMPTFAKRAALSTRRSQPGVVTLKDGTVLVGGGTGTFGLDVDPTESSAERYVPEEDRWYPETPPPLPTGTPAILLDDGSVFFVNGARFYPEAWQ